MSEVLQLWTSGLYSKWGFGDGDAPDAVWDLLIDNNLDYNRIGWRDEIFPRLVEKYVIPLLDQQVTTYRISTPHNPIRAESVNGEAITDEIIYNPRARPDIELTPELIEISMDVVLDEIRSFIKEDLSNESIQGTPGSPGSDQ